MEKTNTGRSGNNERVWSPAETHAKGVNSCGWTHLQEVWTAGREDSQTSPVWLWGLRTGRIHQVWFGVKGASFSKRIWPVVYKSIGMTLTGVRNTPLWLKCFGMWPTHGIQYRHLGDKDDEIRLLGVNKTSQDPILLIWGFLPQVDSLRLQFTSDSRNVECQTLLNLTLQLFITFAEIRNWKSYQQDVTKFQVTLLPGGPVVCQQDFTLILHPRINDRTRRGDFRWPRGGKFQTSGEGRMRF